jgi:O-antigen ligase
MSSTEHTLSATESTLFDRVPLAGVEKAGALLSLAAAMLLHQVKLGGQVTPFEALILFTCGVWVLRSLCESSSFPFPAGAVERGFLLLACAVVLSYAWNLLAPGGANTGDGSGPDIDGGMALKVDLLGFLSVAMIYAGYRGAHHVVQSRSDLERLLLVVTACATLNALVTEAIWIIQTGGVIARYNSDHPLTGSPGVSIWMSSLGFVTGLILLLHGRRSLARSAALWASLAILFLSVAIIVTRQGQVAFLLLLALTLFLSRKHLPRRAARVLPLAAAFLGTLLLWLVVSGRAADMLTSYTVLNGMDAQDIVIRRTMIQASWEIFRAHPLFGIGYGYFPLVNSTPVQVTGLMVFLASPHNGIASIASELGGFGLLAAFLLAAAAFLRVRRIRRRSRDGLVHGFSSLVLAVILMEFLNQFLSNSLLVPLPIEKSMVQLSFVVWFLIGAASALERISPPPVPRGSLPRPAPPPPR